VIRHTLEPEKVIGIYGDICQLESASEVKITRILGTPIFNTGFITASKQAK
jgi:hypothetical protein